MEDTFYRNTRSAQLPAGTPSPSKSQLTEPQVCFKLSTAAERRGYVPESWSVIKIVPKVSLKDITNLRPIILLNVRPETENGTVKSNPENFVDKGDIRVRVL